MLSEFYRSLERCSFFHNNPLGTEYSLHKGESITDCRAHLLFVWFRCNQTSKSVDNFNITKQLNPNTWKRRSESECFLGLFISLHFIHWDSKEFGFGVVRNICIEEARWLSYGFGDFKVFNYISREWFMPLKIVWLKWHYFLENVENRYVLCKRCSEVSKNILFI